MRFCTIFLLLCIMLYGCKTNQTRNNLKEGRWVYKDTVNGIPYKSTGKYRRGAEKKKWYYYVNNKLVKKETYKYGFCYTDTFHEDGEIASQGKTKIITTDSETHWCYVGVWRFYDNNCKLIRIKEYDNGELIKDTIIE